MEFTYIFQIEENRPFFLKGEHHVYKISELSEGHQALLYQNEFGGWDIVPPSFVLSAIKGAPNNVSIPSLLSKEEKEELHSLLNKGYRYLTRGYYGEIRAYDKHPRNWVSCPNVADTIHVIQLNHLPSLLSSLIPSREHEPLDIENLLKHGAEWWKC